MLAALSKALPTAVDAYVQWQKAQHVVFIPFFPPFDLLKAVI